MKTTSIYALAFLILGVLLGAGSTYALTKKDAPTAAVATTDHASMKMDSSSDAMSDALKGKIGDDFDRAFLDLMIQHHQGAVEMATQARQDAKHNEIKAMAEDIISAQTREIGQMKSWQEQWGY